MNAETPFARCQAQQAGMGDIQTTIQVREVSHSQGEPKSDRHLAHTVNRNDSRLPYLPALCYLDVLSEQNPDLTANSRTVFHMSSFGYQWYPMVPMKNSSVKRRVCEGRRSAVQSTTSEHEKRRQNWTQSPRRTQEDTDADRKERR